MLLHFQRRPTGAVHGLLTLTMSKFYDRQNNFYAWRVEIYPYAARKLTGDFKPVDTALRDSLIGHAFFTADRREAVLDSERHLLGQLFRRGAMTQAELTECLPLSQQSISRMASGLETRGLVQRGARKLNGQRGQPSAVLSLNPDYAYSIGISLMADGVSLVLSDFTGTTRAQANPALSSLKKEDVLTAARKTVKALSRKAGIDEERIFGAGIATSGFRVGPQSQFNPPPALEDFALIDLEAMFAEALDLPSWADNDGNAAAIGENMRGVGRRLSNFAYFFIATGVGGGVILNGQLLKGVRGNAGEFVGALPIDKYPFPNLERLRQRVNADGGSFDSVGSLVAHYDDRWPAIDAWIEDVAPSLSLMASATTAILDTDAIVLGGRMPRALAERVIPHIQFFDVNRRSTPREHAAILPAECEGDATAIGASLLPFSEKFFSF